MAHLEPDDFQFMQALHRILESSDLTKVSRKVVRIQLEQELGGSFSSPQWRERIKNEVADFVQRKEGGVNAQSNNTQPAAAKTAVTASDSYKQDANPSKRRRLTNGASDEAYNPHNPSHNDSRAKYQDTHRKQPRSQLQRKLIQKSDKDNSHFMKLPGDGAKKRCIIHKFRGKLYIGFREYYEKNGEELPSKKGINLTQEQWEFVVQHMGDINAQIKMIR